VVLVPPLGGVVGASLLGVMGAGYVATIAVVWVLLICLYMALTASW